MPPKDEPEVGLLDTSVVIDLDLLPSSRLPVEMTISTITLAELAIGLHSTADVVELAERQRRFQWAEAAFDAYSFDIEAARMYGMVVAMVNAVGRKHRSRVADLMIASVAIARGLPLYTRNPKDFIGIESKLTVIAV